MRLAEAMVRARQNASDGSEPLRVALVCGFTPLHLPVFLTASVLHRMPGRGVVVDHGLYGDLHGNLMRALNQPYDHLLVLIEWADLDPRLGWRSCGGWRLEALGDMTATATARLQQIAESVAEASKRLPVVMVLPTLPLPPAFPSPPPQCDAVALTLQESVAGFASRLAVVPGIRFLCPYRLAAISPVDRRLDLASELRSGFPYRLEHASAISTLLAEMVCPPTLKKGVITDLDNTLWRGVLGEDGIEGITWDLDHQSHVHALYQQMLASLADMGVLIGVASKNEPQRVAEALRREDLLVSPESLFPIEAGWGPKSESVARILRTWNIAPDSVVFIDDSPMERAEVAAAFPAIECLAYPTGSDQEVYGLLENLRRLFGKPRISREDRLRNASLRARHEQLTLGPRATTDALLADAQAELTLSYNEPDARALELVNKTNQFNLNGQRIGEAAWRRRLDQPGAFLLSASYQDKFGPLGKVAVAAGRCDGDEGSVDVWVMSCRAFSRRVEHHMLKSLFEILGVRRLVFNYVPTQRNQPMREFFRQVLGHLPEQRVLVNQDSFLQQCPPLHAKVHFPCTTSKSACSSAS